MKTTPFTEKHIALGAKMHEFAGYNMPIEYLFLIQDQLRRSRSHSCGKYTVTCPVYYTIDFR